MESSGKNSCRSRLTWCLLLGLAGCSDEQITAYRVPKDPGAPAAVTAAEPGAMAAPLAPVAAGGAKSADNTNDLPHAAFGVMPSGAAGEASLRWEAPPAWEAQPVSAMRKGSYTVSRGGVAAVCPSRLSRATWVAWRRT
jgi:hypothetical protein